MGKRQDLPSEFALAAACARWPHSAHRVDAVREAARSVKDWGRFGHVVRRHAILGLAYDGIATARAEVPGPVREALRADAFAMARRSVAQAAEAVRLYRDFAGAGIPCAFLKGATLAMLAYGRLGLRQAADIDIIVPEAAALDADAILAASGYCRVTPPSALSAGRIRRFMVVRKSFDYVHAAKGIQTELHWRLADNPLLGSVPAPATWSSVSMPGGAELPTLGWDDHFAYLCAHGASHAWFRLKWLADIGALVASEPGGADRLYSVAKDRGAARPAEQAMVLLNKLYGMPLPAALAKDGAGVVTRALAWTALKAMTRGNGEIEPRDLLFGSTFIHGSEYFLKDWRFLVAQLRRDLANPGDWIRVPLPEQLDFLYPLLRVPLWLWRHLRREAGVPRQ